MGRTKISIEKDIRKAHTLPGWAYGSAEVYEAARERIFARSWQFVVGAEEVRTPRQVFPFTFLEGCIDEPLLLTRDENDQLHCMSNVCTHRGALVCDHPGHASQLRCRYHGRRFDLAGTFRDMPEFEEAKGFPTEADDLPGVQMAQWGPLVFCALKPQFAFDELFEDVQRRLGWLDLEALRFDASRSRDYLVDANWALYCDNYLEGFHIPFVHASLNQVLDYGDYRAEVFRYSNLQLGTTKGGDAVFELPKSSPDHGESIAAYYYWLFPNLMLNFYPWGLSVNVVRPLGPQRSKVSFLTYVSDASKLDEGAGAGLDRVEREDEEVVESVQRGVRSRLYQRGRFSPTREQGVHHFHRLLAEFLDGA